MIWLISLSLHLAHAMDLEVKTKDAKATITVEGQDAKINSIKPLKCASGYFYVEYQESFSGSRNQKTCKTALLLQEQSSKLKTIDRLQFNCDEDGGDDAVSFYHNFAVILQKGTPAFQQGSTKSTCL